MAANWEVRLCCGLSPVSCSPCASSAPDPTTMPSPPERTTSPTLKPRINSFLPENAFCQHSVTVTRKLSSLLVSGSPDVLYDGVPVCDVPEHHALDDAVVLLFWEVLVGHKGDVVLGGWWGVHSLEPRVALNLFQRGSPFRVSLQHPCDQAAKEGSPLLKQTVCKDW